MVASLGVGPIRMTFLATLAGLVTTIQTSEGLHAIPSERAMIRAAAIFKVADTLYFVGNGGSAAIASHAATDYTKNGDLRALTFNDASLITCLSNDFSYDEAFARAVTRFVNHGDALIAISSSGASRNILNACAAARMKGAAIVTLSGFEPTNPLRTLGRLNFYVPSTSYGLVESAHTAVLHAILEDHVMGHA